MITYCVILLFLACALVQGVPAVPGDDGSSSQDIRSAIDELSSQLSTVVDKHVHSYRMQDSNVVSSSLLQMLLLQHIINGHEYNSNSNNGTPFSVSAILERLDEINSSIKTSIEEAVTNISSAINNLTDEVQQSTDAIMTL